MQNIPASTKITTFLSDLLYCADKAEFDGNFAELLLTICKKFNEALILEPNPFPFKLIQYGFIDALKLILEAQKTPTYKTRVKAFNYRSQTLLYYACSCNQFEMAEYLINYGFPVNDECNNETPLLRVAKEGYNEICALLMKHKANLQSCNAVGENALHLAARNGHVEICKLLLATPIGKTLLRAFSAAGLTCFHIAAQKLEKEVLRILLENGYPVNETTQKTDQAAIHFVCAINSESQINLRMEIIDLLVEYKADLSLKCQTQLGKTGVIELACVSPLLTSHLLHRGAPPVSPDEIERRRDEARKKLGQLCYFEDSLPSEYEIEHDVIHCQHKFSGIVESTPVQERIQHKAHLFTESVRPWKTIRLFLSSTFLDMQSEREHLIKRVLPKIKEKCEQKRIHLIDIDLRWGVTEEEVNTGKALEVCLSEARNADIFIGILGNRYGWVPKPHEITEMVKNQYSWENGCSITEMEMREGVFNRQNFDSKSQSFFFVRSDMRVPQQHASIYEESDTTNQQRLQQLKQTIKSRYNCMEYTPSFQSGKSTLTDLEDFARSFEQQITKIIQKLAPVDNNQQVDDPEVVERTFHSKFIEMRSISFIGRRGLLDQIEGMIEQSFFDFQTPLVISGGPGSGKSSLMAKLASELIRNTSSHELSIVYHFVGGSPSSINIRSTLHRICSEIINSFELSVKVAEEYEDLEKQFKELLTMVSNERRKNLLIIIDALNQFDYSNQSHTLQWLPISIPDRVGIIVSCLPSDCLDVLEQRNIPTHIRVPVLAEEDRKDIISQTLGKYQKKLTEKQMQIILNKPDAIIPLYLTIICEELRVFGEFNQLDSKLNEFSERVSELLGQVLQRFENEHGIDLVKRSLSLLESSRFGLLEEELLSILNISRFQWGELFLSLQFFLRPIGSNDNEKVLDFFHRQISKAVRRRYLDEDESFLLDIHKNLSDYFFNRLLVNKSANPSDWQFKKNETRSFTEIIYHLFHSNQFELIAKLLTSLTFIEQKSTIGYTYDLVKDYLLFSSTNNPSAQPFIQEVQPYMEFVLGNTHIIDEFPNLILQMAVNLSNKSPLYLAATKQLKNLKKQKNHQAKPLFEWQNKPKSVKNKQQFRSLNIGARVNCARGTSDSKLIAVGDINGVIKLYNASTAEELAVLLQSPTRITHLSFSNDGKYLLASTGIHIFFWDISSKTLIYQISLNSDDINSEILCVEFGSSSSKESTFKVIASNSTSELFIIQVDLKEKSHQHQTVKGHHAGAINTCCFSPNGEYFLSGGIDKQSILYKHSNLSVISKFKDHNKLIQGSAFSPSNKWFITCAQDRLIHVYSLDKKELIATLQGHGDNVECCAVTEDDKYIISGSWDKKVIIWSVADILKTPENVNHVVIGEHSHFLNHVAAFGKNAIITASADTTVKLFQLPSSIEQYKQQNVQDDTPHSDLICGMDYDPVHGRFATACWDKQAKVFDAEGNELALLADHSKRVNDCEFSPETFNFMVTASTDHTAKYWNLENYTTAITFTGHTAAVMSCSISHDERYVATGSQDRSVKLWEVATKNCIGTLQAHSSWVCALKFSKYSRMLASASVDGTAKVWSTKDGTLLAHLRKHTAPILDVKWAQNSSLLITVGEDWMIRIWQVGTWQCIKEISGHKHEVTAAVVLDDVPEFTSMFNCKTLLATSSADKTVRLWDYTTGTQLWLHYGTDAFSYLIYTQNQTLVAGDSRGNIHVLSLTYQ